MFTVSGYLIFLKESTFNMTGGGGGEWKFWNSKLEILVAPLASGSIF